MPRWVLQVANNVLCPKPIRIREGELSERTLSQARGGQPCCRGDDCQFVVFIGILDPVETSYPLNAGLCCVFHFYSVGQRGRTAKRKAEDSAKFSCKKIWRREVIDRRKLRLCPFRTIFAPCNRGPLVSLKDFLAHFRESTHGITFTPRVPQLRAYHHSTGGKQG